MSHAYIPIWEAMVRTYAPGLVGVTPEVLPNLVRNLSVFGSDLLKKSNHMDEMASVSQITVTTIGASLALALHKAGWDLYALPGEPVYAQRVGKRIIPFEIMGKLASARLSAEAWREQCADAGIKGVDFSHLAPVPTAHV